MVESTAYCCNNPDCKQATLQLVNDGLICPNGHKVLFATGTKIPVFDYEKNNATEYSRENAAEIHDNSLTWVFKTFAIDEQSLRENLINRLNLKRVTKLLVTGVGTGNDLPFIEKKLQGAGEIYSQDSAQQMLITGYFRHKPLIDNSNISFHFSISDATNLPFKDDYFDAAYHFGGINLFGDIQAGLSEMNRVVRRGGKIVVGDEGVAPWLKETQYGKMLIANNSLYNCELPLWAIPETALNVQVSWILGNCFYILEFTAGSEPPKINIDVPHVGVRGGTIRTRYFGQLEGIDPNLRDQIYAEADQHGLDRVAYIESLLRRQRDR